MLSNVELGPRPEIRVELSMHINWLLIDNADTQAVHFSTKSDSITTQHETTNRVEALHILAVSSSAGIVQVRSGFVVMHKSPFLPGVS